MTTGHPDRARGGFTLIEMMVVVAMISLLTLLAAPHIDYMKMRLNSAASTAALTLMAAQREAVSRQHDMVVMFDQGNQTMRILYDVNNNGVEDAGERVRPVALDEHVQFGRSTSPARPMGGADFSFTKMVSGMPALTFHRNGSASEEGGFYLTSDRAANGATAPTDDRAIEVVRATGRAEAYWYDGTAWQRR